MSKKNSTKKNSLYLLIGLSFSQLINFLTLPIITRLFTPDDYGVFTIAMTISTFFIIISTLNYDKAVILPKEESKSKNLLRIIVINSVALSLISVAVVFLAQLSKLPLLIEKGLTGTVLLLIIGITFFTAIYQAFYYYNNRFDRYLKMSMSRIIMSVVFVGLAILFPTIYRDSSVEYLLIAQLVSVFGVCLFLYMPKQFPISTWKFRKSRAGMVETAKEYSSFPKYNVPHAILDIVSANLIIVIITILYNMAYVGLFAVVLRVLKAPISLIGTSLSQVYNREVAKMLQEKQYDRVRSKTKGLIIKLIFVSTPLFIVFAFFSETIFDLFLGEKWVGAGKIASILIIWISINFISSPISQTYILVGEQKKALILSGAQNVLLVIYFGFAFFLKLEFMTFLLYFSLISAFNNLVFAIWTYQITNGEYLKKKLNTGGIT
jgi:O-antigen/teichoic acid export membrane protein